MRAATAVAHAGQVPQDLIAVLLEDHWYLERLLERLDAERDPAHLRRLVGDLHEGFLRHEAVEVEVVGPLTGVPDQDIGELGDLLAGLRQADPGDDDFRARASEVVARLSAHLEREERDVLPSLRSTLTPAQLEHLGAAAHELRRGGVSA